MWHSSTSGARRTALGEVLEGVGRRLVERDLDEDQKIEAEPQRIERAREAVMKPSRCRRFRRSLGRGRRQADAFGEFDAGDAAVGLQQGEDAPVGPIETVMITALQLVSGMYCKADGPQK